MKTNLFETIPPAASAEIFTELLRANNVRIERIVSSGQASPQGFWYDQPEHEWVLLLEGRAQLRFENQTVELQPGDYLNIPAGMRHRIESTAPDRRTVWLAVFYS